MKCLEFEQILEQQDAPFPASAVAHLEGCDSCRGLATDFDAIHAAALQLDVEQIEVPERVWISLRNQLEAEGLIHEEMAARERAILGWWTGFQRPAFAGAFLSLVLIAAGMIVSQNGSVSSVSNGTSQAGFQLSLRQPRLSVRDQLVAVVNEAEPQFEQQNALMTASFHRNLDIVDNFIALCENSVREQPDNDLARDYLNRAYEQKAELLATAMDHGTMGGLQ